MAEMKHTPGPWTTNEDRLRVRTYAGIPDWWECTVHAGDGNALAIVCMGGQAATTYNMADVFANALLIARAPALLAENERLARELCDFNELIVAPLKRQRDELAGAGHALGLLALQSDRYQQDADYREATDAMLAALRSAGRLPAEPVTAPEGEVEP